MKQEIELKIALAKKEFQQFTKHLKNRQLEKTFGFFKEDFSNVKEGVFPRLKYIKGHVNKLVLTVKVKSTTNNRFFSRDEMEIEIQDTSQINELRLVIKALGYGKEIIFEKIRCNIVKDDMVISFDELPFGYFVEFEGSPKAIEKYRRQFKLNNRPTIKQAYLALWEDYRQTNQIKNQDCVF